MKNKKSIAIAMSAMTVAGAVVPAFANSNNERVITVKDTVNSRTAKGRELLTTPIHEDNLKQFLLENAAKNPKKVGKLYSNGKAWYAIEVDMDLVADKDVQKDAAIKFDQMKKDLQKLYDEKWEGEPRYKFEIREENVELGSDNQFKDGKTSVYVTDRKYGNDPVACYVFDGTCNFIEDDVVDVERVSVSFSNETANKEEEYKKLAKYIYKIDQANAKGKIYVTTSLGENGHTLSVNVYRADKKVLLGQITIYSYDGLSQNTLAQYIIPSVNDFNGHWAEKEIIEAMHNGQVALTGKFRPKENITRAEFASMVYKIYGNKIITNGANPNKEVKFTDVQKEDWFYTPIMALAEEGHINGYSNGTFNPKATITRQEAAAILASIAGVKEDKEIDINGKEIHHDTLTKFDDDKSIATWADKSVKALSDDKVIVGYKEGNKEYFKPANKIQRVEALVMMQRGEALVEVPSVPSTPITPSIPNNPIIPPFNPPSWWPTSK